MDVILVNSINFSEENAISQLGLLSLKKVLDKNFKVEIINFDKLAMEKKRIFVCR